MSALPRRSATAAVLLAAVLAQTAPLPAPELRSASEAARSSGEYPFDVRVPFDAALFHWIDSLAGTSGGKTIPIYQSDFSRRFGSPSAEDLAVLRAFRTARKHHANGSGQGEPAPPRGPTAMLGLFLEGSQDWAIDQLATQLGEDDLAALRRALSYFRPRYQKVWTAARYLPEFAEDLERRSTHGQIEECLSQLARFFGVDATQQPRPTLVLVPVPRGDGTHAQAVGRNLLLEIRPDDSPLDQISVIAHENSHFLFSHIPEDRMRSLQQAAAQAGPGGQEAWRLIHEGLPTALGQGLARARVQRSGFSMKDSWYHIEEVDRFAKRIFPLVKRAIEEGRSLDEALVREIVAAAAPAPRAASSD